MKLIVGLGNPGSQYTKTRHNAGFMVVDRLVDKFARGGVAKGRFNSAIVEATIGSERCMLMKPATYMNRSGQSVGEAAFFYKLNLASDLLVVTDDIYLPVGSIRMRPGGGTAGHNGLEDIRRALGGDNYPRLRVGVNAKPTFMDQADYVLSRFTDEEMPGLESSVDKAAQACEVFANKGLDAAMNFANAPPPDPGRPKKPRPPDGPPEGGDPKNAELT
jgi:PTH1 family peptidyl-tRNA hydrolase